MSANLEHKISTYQEGSVKELFSISMPLMLMSLSASLMMFADRIILSRYSLDAMNGQAIAYMVCVVFQMTCIAITAIAEVFVGQHNGAKHYSKIGEPVWQMIWLSLITGICFIPIGMYCGPFFIQDLYQEYGVPYFKYTMFFLFASPLNAALFSFYIGRGKTAIISILVVLGNIINIVLAYLFVFGLDGIIPSMGVIGAAIAMGIAQLFQSIVLLILFLSKHNRKTYGTNKYAFNAKIFCECFKIGFPNSLSHLIEMIAWTTSVNIIASLGPLALAISTIGQSIIILFMFVTEGLNKGIVAITSNFIGANKIHKIKLTLISSVKLVSIFTVIFSIISFFYSKEITLLFINETNISEAELLSAFSDMNVILACIIVQFFVWGISWTISGVLIAAGDTSFMMYLNSLSVWIFSILPIYILLKVYHYGVKEAWMTICAYGFVNLIGMYLRYRSNVWKKIILVKH